MMKYICRNIFIYTFFPSAGDAWQAGGVHGGQLEDGAGPAERGGGV